MSDPAPAPKDMLLREYMQRYFFERDLSDSTHQNMRVHVNAFERFLERPATLEDLNSDAVNGFIMHMRGRGMAPLTIRQYRNSICTFWHLAYQERILDTLPTRVMRIKVPKPAPIAFTVEDMKKLLEAADKLKWVYKNGIPRKLWWRAFILVMWDTGLRLGDMVGLLAPYSGRHQYNALRWDQVNRKGDLIGFVMNKTGDSLNNKLNPPAMRALDKIREPQRDIVFEYPHTDTQFYFDFRQIAKAAGVQGTSKYIRRGAATQVEKQQPGSAMAFLGHKTPGLAERNYIDPTQIERVIPTPPILDVEYEVDVKVKKKDPRPLITRSRLDPHREEIEQLLAKGVSRTQLAKKYGVSRPALYKWMCSRNVWESDKSKRPGRGRPPKGDSDANGQGPDTDTDNGPTSAS